MSLFSRCWRDHKWFPDLGRQEFIPVQDVCLRCRAVRTHLPWGECLGGHPIQDHYESGDPMVAEPVLGVCPGPS